jgi:predicted dehydrogenase
MRNNKFGLGIVGMGGFGQFLLQEWSRLDDIAVVATSDENPECAPENRDDVKFYQSYSQMLDDPEVDIVSISTPPSAHLRMSLEAIAKGKHLLIEKPLALSAEDGRRIAEAARQAGVVATVNFMLRFDPLVEGMKRVIEAGVFGKPRRVDLSNYATQGTVPSGHWFWNQGISGGIMIEHGVHFFDMTSYMLGVRAIDAVGMSAWRNSEQEDRVFAAVRFEDDVIGTYWHSFTRPKPLEITTFRIAFDLGDVEIDGWIPLAATFKGWTNESGLESLREHLPGLQMTVEDFPATNTDSSGLTYPVSKSVIGRAQVEQPKLEVYGNLVRANLMDVVAKIKNPSHELRVNLEDGIAAVAIAEKATEAIKESVGH